MELFRVLSPLPITKSFIGLYGFGALGFGYVGWFL